MLVVPVLVAFFTQKCVFNFYNIRVVIDFWEIFLHKTSGHPVTNMAAKITSFLLIAGGYVF
jgi:hypothetical protein